MSEPISFFVAGTPKGQPRPRAFARNMGGGKFVARVFDSGTAEAWKADIAAAAAPHKPTAPISGPVRLRLVFSIARPKGHYIAGKMERGIRPSAPFYHVGKPDADNLAKAVMDAITTTGAIWHDDAQVAMLEVRKRYTNSETGVQVVVSELGMQEVLP